VGCNHSGRDDGCNRGCNREGSNGRNNGVLERALKLHREGFVIKLRKVKGRLYLYARKYVKEKRERVWVYVGPATEEVVEKLKELGVLDEAGASGATATENTTTRQGPR